MSKRIPVYLSKEELETILSWKGWAEGQGMELAEYDNKLIIKLEEQLRTFEET